MSVYDSVFDSVFERSALIPDTYPSEPPQWDLIALNPGGNEFVINLWNQVDLTVNSEGTSLTVTVPAAAPVFEHLVVLVTDVLLYRNHVFVARLRVLDIADTLTADDHVVQLTCGDYRQILSRRILFKNWEADNDQFNIAWNLVAYTQDISSLGITRGTTEPSGVNRDMVIQRGASIADAINEMASSDRGFDWWIDQYLGFYMQRPRRHRYLNLEWKWGVEVREVSRAASAAEYASIVYVIGATSATQTTNEAGKVTHNYPPPRPQILAASPRPYGRWERTYAFTDVVKADTLKAKGKHLLKDLTGLRPTFAITLEPGVWNPDGVRYGDIFWLRINSPPRLNMRGLVRVEEVKATLTDVSEVVTMSLRAEATEEPIPVIDAQSRSVIGLAAQGLAEGPPPDGEEDVDLAEVESGATFTTRRLSITDQIAMEFTGLNNRLERLERGVGGLDEVWIGDDQPEDVNDSLELWYDPDS